MFAYKVSDSIGEFNIFHVLRNCICIFSVILSLCSFSLYVIFYFCYFRVLAATVHFAVNRFLFLRLMDIVNMWSLQNKTKMCKFKHDSMCVL